MKTGVHVHVHVCKKKKKKRLKVEVESGGLLPRRISTIVKPPKLPEMSRTEQPKSKAVRFLVSFFIPPHLIRLGLCCCNP